MHAIIGRVKDDGVVRYAEVVQLFEQLPDMTVMFDHSVPVLVLAGDTQQLLLHMRSEVHAGSVPPTEEGLAGLVSSLDEVE